MPLIGVASADERTVATRDEGVAREADRTVDVRAVADEARDARGRATLATLAVAASPAEATGADARGVGSAVLLDRSAKFALWEGSLSLLWGLHAGRRTGGGRRRCSPGAPGVVEPRGGRGGIGCACAMAEAARDSRR